MPKKNCAEITRDGKCEPAFYPGGRGDYPFSARGDNSDVDVIISSGECERRRVPPRTRRRTGCNRHKHTYTRTKKKLRTISKRIVSKRGLINPGGGTATARKRKDYGKKHGQLRRFLPLRSRCGYAFAISTRTCYAREAPPAHPRVLAMAPPRPPSGTRTFLRERRTSRPQTTAREQWMGGPNAGVRRAKRADALPPMVGERRRDPAISAHDH